MEVHPPHGPVHSWKDFMLHMVAITLGLLIAIGLESTVEWFHHRSLVREAKESIAAEVRDNREHLQAEIAALPGEEQQLETMVQAVDALQRGQKPDRESISRMHWAITRLSGAAWDTSSATGATAHMGYAAAKEYARLYTMQQLFNDIMDRYWLARAEMYAELARLQQPGKPSQQQYEDTFRTVNEQLVYARFLEEIGHGLEARYSTLEK